MDLDEIKNWHREKVNMYLHESSICIECQLIAKVERLKTEIHEIRVHKNTGLLQQKAEIKRLREALEWYRENYEMRGRALKLPCSHCGKEPVMIHTEEALKGGAESEPER